MLNKKLENYRYLPAKSSATSSSIIAPCDNGSTCIVLMPGKPVLTDKENVTPNTMHDDDTTSDTTVDVFGELDPLASMNESFKSDKSRSNETPPRIIPDDPSERVPETIVSETIVPETIVPETIVTETVFKPLPEFSDVESDDEKLKNARENENLTAMMIQVMTESMYPGLHSTRR